MKKILDKLNSQEKSILTVVAALLLVFTFVQPLLTILTAVILLFVLAWYTVYGKRR